MPEVQPEIQPEKKEGEKEENPFFVADFPVGSSNPNAKQRYERIVNAGAESQNGDGVKIESGEEKTEPDLFNQPSEISHEAVVNTRNDLDEENLRKYGGK